MLLQITDLRTILRTTYVIKITLGARDFSSALRPTAEDVSAFGQHRKFPPYARKASGTQVNVRHMAFIFYCERYKQKRRIPKTWPV